MTQYIETTNELTMIALQEKVNAHLDGINCKTVVETEKHLTEDKWFFDYDLFKKTICKSKKAEREQQIGEFISDNDDINYVEYTDGIEAGYKELEINKESIIGA